MGCRRAGPIVKTRPSRVWSRVDCTQFSQESKREALRIKSTISFREASPVPELTEQFPARPQKHTHPGNFQSM